MKFLTYSMNLTLNQILRNIPDNSLIWSVLFFDGAGLAPDNLSIPEFEELARTKKYGYILSWSNLLDFSKNTVSLVDCLLVAAKSTNDISENRSKKENYLNCEIVLEGFDGCEWSFWARDKCIMKNMTSVFESK